MAFYFEEPPLGIRTTNLSVAEKERSMSSNSEASLPPDLDGTSSATYSIRDDESELSDQSMDLQLRSAGMKPGSCSAAEKAAAVAHATPVQQDDRADTASFLSLRVTYLIVTLVVMLADGLQGTHLYVLYEGYGFTVANLYCLGFVTGGLASPITGPLVDKLGRKKSALLYCILEILINRLEQYPVLAGLIFSRMVGGITTNLLSTVFDTWLDTEYRRRGIRKEGGYEIIMRDSVIVSNLAAIGSGYLAHTLAAAYGPKGPFEGAVMCTTIALIVIMFFFTENYGCGEHEVKGMKQFMKEAITAFKSDSKVLRLGIIQGLTCGSIQIFIFLWSPALRHFAASAPKGSLGVDENGEPEYGLIFGGFMAAGVFGGLAAPSIRKLATSPLTSPESADAVPQLEDDDEDPNNGREDAAGVEVLSSFCYMASAGLLLLPCLLDGEGFNSFSICLCAFLIYEFIVGLYLPWEGVQRSLYFPAEGRASILTLPRIIVNVAVSFGVVLTNYMTMRAAFSSIVVLMVLAAGLQLSLVWRKSNRDDETWGTTPGLARSSFLGEAGNDDDGSLTSDSEITNLEEITTQKVKRE